MKRLLYILLFSFVPLCLFSQTINVDTLLLIDTNATAKGKLYYLRFSNDTLYINSDTVVSGSGDSFWYKSGIDTIKTDNHIILDSSIVSTWNGTWLGNNGNISGFDSSVYGVVVNWDRGAYAAFMSAFQSGTPTVQMTVGLGDQGSQVYLEPSYLLIASDSLLFSGLLEGEAEYLIGQDADGQVVLTENSGGAGADTCLWEITSGDTIDTKGYNIKLDSSFLMLYEGNYLGMYDLQGYDSTIVLGIPGKYSYIISNSTDFGTNEEFHAIINDEIDGLSIQKDAFKLGELPTGLQVFINSGSGDKHIIIGENPTRIDINSTFDLIYILTDSLLIDTLPKSAERFLMMYDSTSGQVSIMDTTGWGGGGMGGGTNYWTYVDDATDTLYNNKPDTSGIIFLKNDVKTDRWLNSSTNTVFGIDALGKNSLSHSSKFQGWYNTSVGNISSYNMTSGYLNTSIGAGSLYSTTSGYMNTSIGSSALYSNITGNENTAIGFNSLTLNTSDSQTAIGANSLAVNTTGIQNTAIGTSALTTNTTGYYNVAVGYCALHDDTTANENVAIGWCSLFHNKNGSNNTAVGSSALVDNTTGSENTAIGFRTLWKNTTGTENVALGNLAGNNNLTGSYNVFLGYSAGSSETGSNKLYIENSNSITPLIFGDFAADSIRINGSCDITDFLKLVPRVNPPSTPSEGMIYADTDHHLYYYNGTGWVQLDN